LNYGICYLNNIFIKQFIIKIILHKQFIFKNFILLHKQFFVKILLIHVLFNKKIQKKKNNNDKYIYKI